MDPTAVDTSKVLLFMTLLEVFKAYIDKIVQD